MNYLAQMITQRTVKSISDILPSLLVISLVFAGFAAVTAQSITQAEVQSHLRFLASDELKGRQVGKMGANVAAAYIAEQFRKYGATPIHQSYFQQIPFKQVSPPESTSLKFDSDVSLDLTNLIVLSRSEDTIDGEVVFSEFASDQDLEGLDLAGKIVLSHLGSETTSGAQEGFQYAQEKRAKVMEKGARALIEIYQGRLPWNLIKNYLGQERTVVDGDPGAAKLTHLVVNDDLQALISDLQAGDSKMASIEMVGGFSKALPSANVIAQIVGTDSTLRDQYIVLTAHYDHVGTRVRPDRPETKFDSVFNGARDNALGVSALLTAAQELSVQPPRRSVMLVAFTAEEIGLLGSKYFVENPIVPLQQMVFNLNTDGAGYSDTSLISIMGLNRVGAAEELTQACNEFGLNAFADPAPNQGLFDRSDNVSFAKVGIPAPTFSPGFRDFDQSILEHYHQPSDEVETLDFSYVFKFCRAYARAARLIADKDEQPKWSEGDKYEKAFHQLFGK